MQLLLQDSQIVYWVIHYESLHLCLSFQGLPSDPLHFNGSDGGAFPGRLGGVSIFIALDFENNSDQFYLRFLNPDLCSSVMIFFEGGKGGWG